MENETNETMESLEVGSFSPKSAVDLIHFLKTFEKWDGTQEDIRVVLESIEGQLLYVRHLSDLQTYAYLTINRINGNCLFISGIQLNPSFLPLHEEKLRRRVEGSLENAANMKITSENCIISRKLNTCSNSCDIEVVQLEGIPDISRFKAPLRSGYGIHICHAQMVPESDLVEFDESIVGMNRKRWVRSFLTHSNTTVPLENGHPSEEITTFPEIPKSVSLVVTTDKGEISAWGSIRPTTSDSLILGPFYALNEKSARLLLRALIDSSRDARKFGLACEIPARNTTAQTLLSQVGLRVKDKEKVYLTGLKEWPRNLEYIYATSNVCSQAF